MSFRVLFKTEFAGENLQNGGNGFKHAENWEYSSWKQIRLDKNI